jgi:hypothetical protein
MVGSPSLHLLACGLKHLDSDSHNAIAPSDPVVQPAFDVGEDRFPRSLQRVPVPFGLERDDVRIELNSDCELQFSHETSVRRLTSLGVGSNW